MSSKKEITMKIQSLKSATAKKLRGNGLIHYHLIIHNKKLFLVLQKNDDGGHFSNEIVSFERIAECVEGLDEPVVSRVFRSAFDSKSTNNAGFLLAVLRHESLLQTGEDGKHYIQPNWDKWEKTTLAMKPEEVDLPCEFTDWSAKNAKAK
jgi:hypothetical protein